MNDDPTPESQIEDDRQPERTEDLAELHREALERFDSVALPSQEIRAAALEDRRFVTIPGAQWEGPWGELWSEDAPRPEVDKITKSLEKIETDYRENRLTVDYIPVSGSGDAQTAETLDGMHRADSHDFKAQQARDNAFQEGIRGGMGAWRLTTDLVDPYDPDNESQRVNPAMIIVDADQSVFFDGNARTYDKSDAQWAFVITADTRAVAERKYGSDLCDWPDGLRYGYDWFTPDLVRIAEYYVKEDVPDELLTLTQKTSGEEQRYFASEIDDDELRDMRAKGWTVKRKKIKRCRVRKYILNGNTVLRDCGYIAGPNIPIVPFYGRRDYVDGQERFRGHVAKMKDRQRIYNTRVAKLVERDATSPREVPIFDPSQIDASMAEDWARANIDRLPFLQAHALRNANGDIAHIGPIGSTKESDVPPVTAALLQAASADLTEDDDNADQVKANTSAEAMDIAAARVDAKSGIYLDNMRQSIEREAEIYLGMAREVYYEAGREVPTLSLDGKDGKAKLMEPYIGDDGVFTMRNDIARGRYKVVASVQESTATKRQKTVKQDLEVAQVAISAQDMELAQICINHAILNMDGEGTQEIQDYVRRKLIGLGVVKPTPEEQQQIEAAQAENDNQPDLQQEAALAAIQEMLSKVELNKASAEEKKTSSLENIASQILKMAQAQAVGGPESVPETPSGFDQEQQSAETDLKLAQAENLRSQVAERRIRLGSELSEGGRE